MQEKMANGHFGHYNAGWLPQQDGAGFWGGQRLVAIPALLIPVPCMPAAPVPHPHDIQRLRCLLCGQQDWPDPFMEIYFGSACGSLICFSGVVRLFETMRSQLVGAADLVLEEVQTHQVPVLVRIGYV